MLKKSVYGFLLENTELKRVPIDSVERLHFFQYGILALWVNILYTATLDGEVAKWP